MTLFRGRRRLRAGPERTRMAVDYDSLIQRMLGGDRSALARLMTLVESRGSERPQVMSRLHQRYGRAGAAWQFLPVCRVGRAGAVLPAVRAARL